jgi:hypothetical protein
MTWQPLDKSVFGPLDPFREDTGTTTVKGVMPKQYFGKILSKV